MTYLPRAVEYFVESKRYWFLISGLGGAISDSKCVSLKKSSHPLFKGYSIRMLTVLDAGGQAISLVAAVAGVLRVVPRRVEGVGERHEAPRQELVVTDLNGKNESTDPIG